MRIVQKRENMKYGIPDKKSDKIDFQPEQCLDCRKIWGVDCTKDTTLADKVNCNGFFQLKGKK